MNELTIEKPIALRTAKEIIGLPNFLGKQDEVKIANPKAIKVRDELLLEVDNVEQVVGPDSQQSAADALTKINGMLREVEETRVEIKAPFLGICQKIEKEVKEFIEPLLKQKARIIELTNGYQRKVDEERRAAEEAQRKEAERIERERAQEERIAKEKEAAALAEGNPAAAEAVRQEAELRNAHLNQQLGQVLQPIEQPKAEGMRVSRPWTFRVIGTTDAEKKASLLKAVAARPDLFDVVPKLKIINAELKGKEGKVEIPGLEIYQDTKTNAY